MWFNFFLKNVIKNNNLEKRHLAGRRVRHSGVETEGGLRNPAPRTDPRRDRGHLSKLCPGAGSVKWDHFWAASQRRLGGTSEAGSSGRAPRQPPRPGALLCATRLAPRAARSPPPRRARPRAAPLPPPARLGLGQAGPTALGAVTRARVGVAAWGARVGSRDAGARRCRRRRSVLGCGAALGSWRAGKRRGVGVGGGPWLRRRGRRGPGRTGPGWGSRTPWGVPAQSEPAGRWREWAARETRHKERRPRTGIRRACVRRSRDRLLRGVPGRGLREPGTSESPARVRRRSGGARGELWDRNTGSGASPSRRRGVSCSVSRALAAVSVRVGVTDKRGAPSRSPSPSALERWAGCQPSGEAGMWAGFPGVVRDGEGVRPPPHPRVWKAGIAGLGVPTRAAPHCRLRVLSLR